MPGSLPSGTSMYVVPLQFLTRYIKEVRRSSLQLSCRTGKGRREGCTRKQFMVGASRSADGWEAVLAAADASPGPTLLGAGGVTVPPQTVAARLGGMGLQPSSGAWQVHL